MGSRSCLQIICGAKYLKKEGMTYQQAQVEKCLFQSHPSSII